MARTAITVMDGAWNAGRAESKTNVDQPNGMVISSARPDKTVIRVANTDGAILNMIIRAGDSIYPAVKSGQGDISVSVAATTGVSWAGPFESARVLQSDGSMHIDFDASFAGTIEAYQLP
jgi:hypothetical protein